VRKALAKRKEDRFQSATDMQDALAQYSYSRGLKVISRDIAELVRQCLDDRAQQSSDGSRKPSIIDHMLQEEIVKITSVDFEDPGAKPVSADELAAGGDDRPSVVDDGDFIDPRAWSEERLTPSVGMKVVDEIERRTAKDPPAAAPPTPAARSSSPGLPTPAQPTLPAPRAPLPPPGRTPPPSKAPSGLPAPRTPTPPPGLPTMSSQAAEARRSGRHNSALAASVDAALAGAPGGPTPGPEALASVLEPSIVTVGRPPAKKAGRSFLLGAFIGIVLLGAGVAALVMRKNAAAQPAPAAQTAQP